MRPGLDEVCPPLPLCHAAVIRRKSALRRRRGVSLSPVVIVPILTPKLLSLFPLLAGHCRGASSPPAQHGTARDGKTVYACITVRVCAALTVSSLLLFSSCLIMCVCAGNNHAWIYCHFTSFFYRAECIVDPVETKAERKGNDNN